MMAHAQKPYFVFRRNGQVHLNRRGRPFNLLLAAEVCASAVVMLDTPCSESIVKVYWLPIPFASFPFTSLPACHRVPSHFNLEYTVLPSAFHCSLCHDLGFLFDLIALHVLCLGAKLALGLVSPTIWIFPY